MAWEAWVVPDWEYPSIPSDVDFQALLVPTVDSTRALAVMHHLQVDCGSHDKPSAASVLDCRRIGRARVSPYLSFFRS